MTDCGIVVEADTPLPASLVYGSPCQHGHVDHRGRTLRTRGNGDCAACSALWRARSKGHPDPAVDAASILARSSKQAKRLVAAAAKPKPSGKGYVPPAARLTDAECEICGRKVTAIALRETAPGDPLTCSRDCAGFTFAPGAKDEGDVSDAELARVES